MANDSPLTSRWRRNRSTVNLAAAARATPTPQEPPSGHAQSKLERAPSKMSLFNLFSRPKVEKARGHTEFGLDVPEPVRPKSPPVPTTTPKSSLRLNPAPAVQQMARSRSSQMLRPRSLRPTSTLRSPTSGFESLPLFQAYTQAIKHATVQTCLYSPDVLLRTQSQRRQQDILRERNDSVRDLPATSDSSIDGKLHKSEKTHKRLMSSTAHHAAVPQLTNKIYVLTTSSHVLQYSAEGSLDRAPEKTLEFTKDSVAFACDLIPGKHWVLQISQSASEDGTVAIGPKPSLLTRLRSQNSSTRKNASCLLLVLDSPEEMDSWMTIVRREIDSLGTRSQQASSRQSSSTEEVPELERSSLGSHDTAGSHSFSGDRESSHIKKPSPVDSPFQSLYSGSPRIVTSDWEGDRSERIVSLGDTASIHSASHFGKRISTGGSSVATAATSQEQLPLDQLRERSRYSYVSTATSVSANGTGTRNSSRNVSPSPASPQTGAFASTEADSHRSAASLKSVQNAKRRSFQQPLPTTNEDGATSARVSPVSPQRHSMYGPTSPALRSPEQEFNFTNAPSSPLAPVTTPPTAPTSQLAPLLCQPSVNYVRHSNYVQGGRSGIRSSSAPPSWQSAIAQPAREPAPAPASRRQSAIATSGATALAPPMGRRISQTPKPFMRPMPVRPQAQHGDSSVAVPRRMSSLQNSGTPAPLPLGFVGTRSVTAPAMRPPSMSAKSAPQPEMAKSAPPSQQLRRPTSLQVRSDRAPFLSSSRPTAVPARAFSSTPSFVPGKRASTLHHAPSTPGFRQLSSETRQPHALAPRRSMPVIGLPPPAPPPNMPLPPPPPVSAPRAIGIGIH